MPVPALLIPCQPLHLHFTLAAHCTDTGDNIDDLGLIFLPIFFFLAGKQRQLFLPFFLAADSAFGLSSAFCWIEIPVPRAQLETIISSIHVFLLKSAFTSIVN